MSFPWPAETAPLVLGAASLLGDREEQQDRYLVRFRQGRLFLALADGLGGCSGGAQAAELFIKTADKMFCKKPQAAPEKFFADLIRETEALLARRRKKTGLEMRATAVMARLGPQGEAAWAHMGDSRLYLFSPGGKLRFRTRDHALTALAVFNGEMTEEEARHHPDRSVLYQCLGGPQAPRPAFGRPEEPLEDGSSLILCSDGFWEFFPPEDLDLTPEQNLQETIDRAAAEATRRADGDADNTTVLAFRYRREFFQEPPARRPWRLFTRKPPVRPGNER